MPFIPHTEADIGAMLDAIGVADINDLFDEIPDELRISNLDGVPDTLNEMETTRLMHARAGENRNGTCFIGAGAYEHHIPAAIWQIATRGEFYSAYTPYQAEASQGTLQLIYEYQSMIAGLTGMDVSNASLYDGASAVAEAVLMAARANRKCRSTRVLLSAGLNPTYKSVAGAITGNQGFSYESLPREAGTGLTSWPGSPAEAPVAVVIQQPGFFGTVEEVDTLTDAAHAAGALVIAVVNPTSLALLKPPSEWGSRGADIVCGEGQPLGVPLSGGGPYFGFMSCRQAYVRQMPGRIVGRTIDVDGDAGFTLTLQAREQHIRRNKATSNICTNQGLLVTAATIYLALLGTKGLENVARASHANTRNLLAALTAIDGVTRTFSAPVFHEAVVTLDAPVADVLQELANRGIFGGYNLEPQFPELGQSMLVCATEMRTDSEIENYANTLAEIMTRQSNTRIGATGAIDE